MINKLALLLKSKVALVALGTLLVAAVSATAVVAASNRGTLAPIAGQTPSPAHQCSSGDHGTGHTTSTSKDNRGEGNDRDENRHDLTGTITSIDTSNSSFVLTQCDGTTRTVTVSTKTRFEDEPRSFKDLKVGLSVEVEGNLQSNGTFTATSVHREQNDSNDDHDGSDSGGSDDGNHHAGTPAAGTGD
jgi:hypothetical protein